MRYGYYTPLDVIADELFEGRDSPYRMHDPAAVHAVLNFTFGGETYVKKLPITWQSMEACSLEGLKKNSECIVAVRAGFASLLILF